MNDNSVSEIDDLEFLKRGLLLGEGFQLYMVIANTVDERNNLIHELSATQGLVAAVIEGGELKERSLADAILDAFYGLQGQNGRLIVCVSELDEVIAEKPRLLSHLNEQRNELSVHAPGAIVIIGSSLLIGQLRHAAPDAWSIRSADCEVGLYYRKLCRCY
ncbi:MAG: hypothetical protein GY861_04820 [bacterium]|nr:hypothetical protein [bacterium]